MSAHGGMDGSARLHSVKNNLRNRLEVQRALVAADTADGMGLLAAPSDQDALQKAGQQQEDVAEKHANGNEFVP
jgi:hypothetical protein